MVYVKGPKVVVHVRLQEKRLPKHQPRSILRAPLEERGRTCEYFTMMRHPVDRLVSAFFYCPKTNDVQERPAKVRQHFFSPGYEIR